MKKKIRTSRKRLLSVLLAVAMVLTALPLTALSAVAATSGYFKYAVLSETDKTCEITDYTGSATDLTIPSKLDGYTVTGIGCEAFYRCTSLTSVTIPDSVTSIGDGAFEYCTSLTSITLGNGVTSIGSDTFYKCTSLTSITIPDSVTEIGVSAFSLCTSLTSITIPDSVTRIGGGAFEDCTALTSITIPDSVTSIGDWTFGDCTSLTSITIPDSVTSIGWHAFGGCTALTSITIPDSVTSIGVWTFGDCTSLTSITIPDSVTSIGNSAFYNTTYYNDASNWENDVLYIGNHLIRAKSTLRGAYTVKTGAKTIADRAFADCTSLTSITIPNSMTSIGEDAFYNCAALTSITIPNSVTRIGSGAFEDCTSLTSITIPNSVTSIDEDTFNYCTSLTSITIPDSVTEIGNYAFSDCTSLTSITIPGSVTSIGDSAFSDCTSLTSITIPDSVTSIGKYAFKNCTSLTSITIPNSVTSIGKLALSDCTSLVEINVDAGNLNYASESGVLFNKDKTELIRYPEGKQDSSYAIPNSVTRIGGRAFEGCASLASITIPNSVTSIGVWTFGDCTSLTSITIPDSVTSIGNSAFYSCTALTSITIPDSVTEIGSWAFLNCTALTSITIPDSVTSIGSRAFEDCTSLTSITIPNSVTSIGDSAFSLCTSLTSVTLSDGVTSIGNSTFYGCTALTSITIPDSVTSIGEHAFEGCTSLTSITIPDSVTGIGYEAFYRCTSLTSVTLSDGVTSIGNSTFYGCTALTSITIPDSVTSIGSSAFYKCTSLTVIKGYSGSYAESYAKQHGFTFIDISTGLATNGKLTRNNVQLLLFDKDAFLEGNVDFFGEGSASAQHRLCGVHLTAGDIQQDYDNTAVLTAAHLGSNVVFSKNGYQNYNVPAEVVSSWFGSDDLVARNIYMAKDKQNGKPYISGAFAKENEEQTAYTDLQSESLTVLTDTAYDVILTAELRGETVKEYVLSQDNAHKLTSKTGKFSAEKLTDTFAPDKEVYAYVKTTSGKTSEPVKLKIAVTNLSMNTDTFSLVGKDGQSIKFDEDAPLVGGAEISMDGFTLPLGIEVEGNRFKISFGVDVFSLKKSNGGKWKNDTWDSFKKSVSTLQSSVEDATEKLKHFKTYTDTFATSKPYQDKSKNFDVSMLGYAEGYIVNGDMVFTDFSGEIATKFQFKYTQQGTIWVIPVYAYVKAGAAAAIQLQNVRKLPDKDVPFDFGINLNITPELQLGGGVGVKGAVSGGLYGKGALPIGVSFTEKHAKVQLSGEIGIEGECFCFSGKKTILDGTITIYDNYYGKKTATLQAVTAHMFSQTAGALASQDATGTQTSVLPRDYAKNTSKWLGNSFSKRLFSIKSTVSDGLSVQDLQTSVYKNSQSNVITLSDGSMMMAWIEDDSARDKYNRMRLVYSIYKNGLWSTPKAVADDGTNDGYPTLATDGESVYVAWQNIRRTLSISDSDSIQPVLTNSEICLAKYNAKSNCFDAPSTLTDNALYDFSPDLAVNNGQAVVYWQQNSVNDLTVTGSNTIYRYSTADNACTLVKSDLNYILDLTCTWTDGKESAAFSMDTDGDLTTVDDVYTYTLENGVMSVNMTDEQDENPDFSVAYGKLEGEDTLFFADNTAICYVKNGQCVKAVSAVNCINGDLQITELGGETKLLWTEMSECGTELWMSGYADGNWSEPIQVSNLGALLTNVSVVTQNGTLHGVFNRTERTLTDGEYTSGQTDLCYMTLTNFVDLEGAFVTFDESNFNFGETAEIPVYLKNNGTTDIEQVQFGLNDGLGTNQKTVEPVDLPSGADCIVYIQYPVPNDFTNTTLHLTVSVPDAQEINTANNEDSLTIGHTDVSIGDVSVNDVGQYYILTTTVTNTGLLSAQNVQVNICQTSETAAPMDISILGDLQPHEMRNVQFIVEKSAVEFDVNNLGTIYFVLSTDSTEQVTQNNKACALLEKSEPEPIVPTYTLGDVNDDGKINAVDARWVLQAASGARTFDSTQTAAADVNGDGKVNAVDARWILQVASGVRTL